MTWRRGFVLAASLALAAAALPGVAAAQDEEIVVMHYFDAELGGAGLTEILADFQAETGYSVKFVETGHEDFKTGILIQLAGSNPPDAHNNWAGARTAFQVQNGMLAPIDEMWAANGLDEQFGAGMIESAVTYDGAKYLLPFGFHIAPVFYNPKLFTDNGVEIPTTWDELKGACETFNAAGVLPIALGASGGWPAQFYFDYLLLRTAGAEYRASLMAGEASYTDPEVVRAMELWKELIDAGCFADGATVNAMTWTEAADQVVNGEAAMDLHGTWFMGYVNGNGFVPEVDYDFFEFPVIDEGVATAVVGPVDGWVTAAGAANSEAAMEMLAYLSKPEAQLAWSKVQGNIPTNITSDMSQVDNITKRAAEVAAAAETYNFNYDLATPPAPSVVGLNMFQEFLNDPSDIPGLLERTQTEIAAAFEE
jgi:multiple sugar transport system substrate-binding protein/raffinose/stachyose/melibiose transport system substrate-binding protein